MAQTQRKTRPTRAPVVSIRAAAKAAIQQRVNVLGNSKRGLKELASDLLNQDGRRNVKLMVEGTFLSRGTLERIMDCDEYYQPRNDSLERVLRYYNKSLTVEDTVITTRYRNKPKE